MKRGICFLELSVICEADCLDLALPLDPIPAVRVAAGEEPLKIPIGAPPSGARLLSGDPVAAIAGLSIMPAAIKRSPLFPHSVLRPDEREPLPIGDLFLVLLGLNRLDRGKDRIVPVVKVDSLVP